MALDPLDAFMAGLMSASAGSSAGSPKRARRACAHCGAAAQLSRCSRCEQVWYCGAGCQKADYRSHRRQCREWGGRAAGESDDEEIDEGSDVMEQDEPEGAAPALSIDPEAAALAEQGRYLAALARWDATLTLPKIVAEEQAATLERGDGVGDPALRRAIAATHELRAQALLELDRTFDAIAAASRAVRCAPSSPWAHLTLGRAQLNFGELDLALITLERAVALGRSGAARAEATADLVHARALKARQLALLRGRGAAASEALALRARTLPAAFDEAGRARERRRRVPSSGGGASSSSSSSSSSGTCAPPLPRPAASAFGVPLVSGALPRRRARGGAPRRSGAAAAPAMASRASTGGVPVISFSLHAPTAVTQQGAPTRAAPPPRDEEIGEMDVESGGGASASVVASAAREAPGAEADRESSWARHFARSVAKSGGASEWGAMR